MEDNLIKTDVWYHICDNRGQQRIMKIQKGNQYFYRKIKWRKTPILLSQILGYPINSVFKVEGKEGKLSQEKNPDSFYFPNDDHNDEDQNSEDSNKDNQFIDDKTENQKLKMEEIVELKKKEDGDQIIKKIVQNSESFEKKNQYSQIKYLRKKNQKKLHQIEYQIVILGSNQPKLSKNVKTLIKNSFMREDSLAYFLQLSSIRNDSSILMFDNTYGIALAGVAERLDGNGTITCLFSHLNQSSLKNMQPFQQMNFPEKIVNSIKHIQPAELKEYQGNCTQYLMIYEYGFSLLIAGQFPYMELIKESQRMLSPGAVIVVFSSFLEQLTEVAEYLYEKGNNAEISDSFLRYYQVLPERTHPNVSMTAFGGYLLQCYYLQ